jgi:hypothetical protein
MILTFNLPVNGVSFGQTSVLILRTIYDLIKTGADYDVRLFPVGGGYDLASQKQDPEFLKWLEDCIHAAYNMHERSNPIFKLWHLNGSMESFSEKQTLLSFYELDAPTPVELNIARNNKTFFSSKFTCEVFKKFGVETSHMPLAFDSYNFQNTNKTYFPDGRIVFNICGKFEKRKQHLKMIKAWIKKYGNNSRYALQCAIYNPFINAQQNNHIAANLILEGKPKPFNVTFLPSMQENASYNEFLNSGDIVLGMSGGEGWGLPEFQSVALGKHAVILDGPGYSDWSNESNSVIVPTNGKEEAYDGMFFQKGQPFNQGSIFTWDEEAFIAACEKVIARVGQSRLNSPGLKLQTQFSKEKLAESIIKTFDANA